ncbi:MAG: aspartate ammonia-lyase [Candidatus Sumerlaeaceae bacterium]|nr:aspartate ammonia-lyase [Candidatus Sumerlaeaceae bacterium]
MADYRTEKDSLGEKQVPAEAYYGIQSLRARENFPISRHKAHPVFVWSIVQIKRAAANVHKALGLLDAERADAIVAAADEVLEGRFDEHFIIDVYQAGAGTSQNMNANEVIANRANELLGIPKEQRTGRKVHPNDDVNKSQSTNDVIPCAIRVASLRLLPDFEKSLREMIAALRAKEKEFDGIVKSGRTHLQDAVPVRLGQEFGGYADALESFLPRLEMAKRDMGRLGIGGSAAGTGMNVHPDYRGKMVAEIKKHLGYEVVQAPDYFAAMQSNHDAVFLSNVVAGIAIELTRIANDIRLMASGPRTGFAEVVLPAVQPGSSIMPGKVNPSMAEMLNQVCFQVLGYSTAVNYAAQAGQLELNVMMPMMANDIIEMLEILGNAMSAFTTRCITGIKADPERCRWYAENSLSMVTALNTFIGYDKAAEVAKEAVATGKSLREVILAKQLISESDLDKVFDLMPLTEPGIPKAK